MKQVLSANSESPLSVEELHQGIDFRSRITRWVHGPANGRKADWPQLRVWGSQKCCRQSFVGSPCCSTADCALLHG